MLSICPSVCLLAVLDNRQLSQAEPSLALGLAIKMGKCCVNATFVRTQFSNRSTQAIVGTSSGRIEGQKNRETDRGRQGQTYKETDRQRGRHRDRQKVRHTELTAAAGDIGAERSRGVRGDSLKGPLFDTIWLRVDIFQGV